MKELTERYTRTGTDVDEFYGEINAMDERTSYHKIMMSSITLLHICSEKEIENFKIDPKDVPENKWVVVPLNPNNESGEEKPLLLDKHKTIPVGESSEQLLREIDEIGTLVAFTLESKAEALPMSVWAYKDLADRAGVLCSKIMDKSLDKSKWLSDNLDNSIVTLTIRKSEDGRMKKIFAVRGRIFEGQKQGPYIKRAQTLLETEGGLGRSVCDKWEITNENIAVTFSFPEKTAEIQEMYPALPENITPIVDIYTSDIGKSAFHVTSGFTVGKTRIVTKDGSISAEHNKNFKLSSVMEKVEKNIFKQYNSIPKELARLLGIEITDMAAAIEEVLNFTGIEKVSGMKTIAANIKTLLCTELSLGSYTAYDLVNALISSPTRLVMTKKTSGELKVIPESTMKTLNEILSRSIFCPFECETVEYDLLPEE